MELYQTIQTNMQTHTDTDTQSALSDFSRLPNRIYADRMFFTFLKYSAEEYLHGLKRKRRRKFHIHTQQIWCYPMRWNAVSFFHSFSSLHRSLSPSFLPISRVLTYSFILVCAICVYAEGFPLASLVDNNALIFMFPVPCSRWWWWWLRRSIYSNLAIPPCHLMWLLLSLSLCLFFSLSLQQRRGKQNLISCKWNKIKWFCWCLLSKYYPCMVISPMLKHSFDFYIYGFPVEFFFTGTSSNREHNEAPLTKRQQQQY